MMNKNSLAKIYQLHHQEKNRYNFTVYGKKKCEFFSKFIGQGKRILDLGCRDGTLTKCYIKGNIVTGVDIDNNALELLKKKYNISTLWLDLNSEWDELIGKKFDVVVMSEVLEHLYFPDKVLQKVYCLLDSGGILLGSVPNAFRLPSRLRLLLGKKKGTPLEDPTHINHFSYKEIKNMLKITGFKNIVLEPIVKKKYLLIEKIWPGSFSYMIMFKAEK